MDGKGVLEKKESHNLTRLNLAKPDNAICWTNIIYIARVKEMRDMIKFEKICSKSLLHTDISNKQVLFPKIRYFYQCSIIYYNGIQIKIQD